MVEIEVLGPLRVRVDGHDATPTSPTQRLLLAVLAAAAPSTVDRGRLVEAVWGDSPPDSADNSLHSHLSRLRRAIGPGAIVRDGDGYALSPGVRLDAHELEAAVDDLAAHDDSSIVELMATWRGRAFGELSDHVHVVRRAESLERCRRRLRLAHAEHELASGRATDAADLLRTLADDDPHDERTWATLAAALHRDGRSTEAMRVVQRARGSLAEVGLEASGELHTVEAEVLGTGPRRRSGESPTYRTVEFGRGPLRSEVVRTIEDRWWTTLHGPAGVGKTRLAVGVAGAVRGRRPVFVDLTSVDDPSGVPLAVLDALDGGRIPPYEDRIGAALAVEPTLLVLDNCEHVAAAVVELAKHLDTRTDEATVRVLATSRSPVGVVDEHLVDVPPLRRADAIDLLLERSQRSGPGSDDVDAIRSAAPEICAAVDDLPLALELLVGLLRTLEPDQIVARLERPLDLLEPASGSRTLASSIRRSHDLLTSEEATALRRLSVFAAPFTLDTAERVAGHTDLAPTRVAALVASLRDRSLVGTVDTSSGRRLRLLHVVRQFAADELTRHDDRDATIDGYLDAQHELSAGPHGRPGRDRIRRADHVAEHLAELRHAVRTAIEREHLATAAAITTSLTDEAYERVRPEVCDWAAEILSQSRAADRETGAGTDAGDLRRELGTTSTADLLALAALGRFQRGDLDGAAQLAERAIHLDRRHPWAHVTSANVEMARGRLDDAARHAEIARRHGTASHGDIVRAVGTTLAALARWYLDDVAVARDLAADLRRQGSDGAAHLACYAEYVDGELAADHDPRLALTHHELALVGARTWGNALVEGVALVAITSIRADLGDVDDGAAACREAIALWHGRGERTRLLVTLRNYSSVLVRGGAHEHAAVIRGGVRRATPTLYGREARRVADDDATIVEALGTDEARALDAAGAAMSIDELVTLALADLVLDRH